MENLDNQIIVSVKCLVYNHAPYIRQCLDGFVMQKTNFRFEAIVHDDASTDGTQDIIREYAEKYPDIIKPIYETENQYSKRDGSLRKIMNNACNGKYIALCEGDDYWIDPLKLQKQIDFMESHKDCTLCGTNGLIVYQDGLGRPNYFNRFFQTRMLLPEDIIGKWALPTASLLYRKEITENYPEWTKRIYSGDQTLILIALNKGNVYAMGDLTCVYRKDLKGKSISNTVDMSFVLQEHLKLYRNYYNFVENEHLKAITLSYINQLNHKIEQAKAEKTFETLHKDSRIKPFFWSFRYSCKRYKQVFKDYCLNWINKL